MRQQRTTRRGNQDLMANFRNWEWPQTRDMMIFGAGMLLSLAASRVAPPFAGRAIGSMRAMAGTDPFDALAQDHQKVLALFEAIEATDNSATTRRAAMLFQLKRMLTAHALAGAREEYLAAGMDDYVSKPVDQTVLLSKLLELARRLDQAEGIVTSEVAGAGTVDLDDTLNAAGIDCTFLETLTAVMEPAEVKDFLEMYLEEAEQRMSRMATARDLEAIVGDAHALVGTSGNVGASQVSELARSVEIACKRGDEAAARRLLPELAGALDTTSGALNAWLKAQQSEMA